MYLINVVAWSIAISDYFIGATQFKNKQSDLPQIAFIFLRILEYNWLYAFFNTATSKLKAAARGAFCQNGLASRSK